MRTKFSKIVFTTLASTAALIVLPAFADDVQDEMPSMCRGMPYASEKFLACMRSPEAREESSAKFTKKIDGLIAKNRADGKALCYGIDPMEVADAASCEMKTRDERMAAIKKECKGLKFGSPENMACIRAVKQKV